MLQAAKFPIDGRPVAILESLTPNQLARVVVY